MGIISAFLLLQEAPLMTQSNQLFAVITKYPVMTFFSLLKSFEQIVYLVECFLD